MSDEREQWAPCGCHIIDGQHYVCDLHLPHEPTSELAALRAKLAESKLAHATEVGDLKRELADNKRWASEYSARFEATRQRLRTLEERARAVVDEFDDVYDGGTHITVLSTIAKLRPLVKP